MVQAQPPAAALPGTPLASPVAPPSLSEVPVAAIAPTAEVEAAPAPRAARPQAAERAAPQRVVEAVPANPTPATGAEIVDPVETLATEDLTTVPPMASGGTVTETPTSEVTAPPPAPTEGDGEVWGWMAALLAALGVGGGTIALRRTRTRKSAAIMAEARASDAEYDRRLASPHARPPVAPAMTAAAPATASFAQPVIQPAPARPVAHSVNPDGPIDHRRLEALIAQRPTRDNPFKTRANRKRRALYLMRNGYGMQSAA